MVAWWLALLACAGPPEPVAPAGTEAPTVPAPPSTAPPDSTDTAPPVGPRADAVEVSFGGASGAYTVSVTVRSPDTGCDRYADWWELVRPDGTLAYRRILNHSHVEEQPFTRASEGPVAVSATETLIVRAHLHPHGFGGTVLEGSVLGGFVARPAVPGFAEALATAEPLPTDCWF